MQRIVLGGMPCDLVDDPTIRRLLRVALTSGAAGPVLIASVNLDKVHQFGAGSAQEGFFEASRHADRWMVLLDGAPLVSEARRLTGRPWPRLAGADLLPWMLGTAEQVGAGVGFLGGTADAHLRLRRVVEQRWPTLRIAGTWAPSREEVTSTEGSRALAASIRSAATDFLVVALTPTSEPWLDRWADACGVRVGAAFGAAADFLIGERRRAPHALQNLGLEWAWRLACEPRRLARRYLIEGPSAYWTLRRRSQLDA